MPIQRAWSVQQLLLPAGGDLEVSLLLASSKTKFGPRSARFHALVVDLRYAYLVIQLVDLTFMGECRRCGYTSKNFFRSLSSGYLIWYVPFIDIKGGRCGGINLFTGILEIHRILDNETAIFHPFPGESQLCVDGRQILTSPVLDELLPPQASPRPA